ncbi:DNA methylase N-4 [Microbacterium resistens]|uniref:DNA methyltransferase n=1 Tax=Microbacterium resistens TaxID=156977 RepID=UPI001C5A398F|nr:DNA methyltransferase [Microbacterium resistens]MBW1639269.1 DNA methylase N-4 [Microbacterium resistens]
MTPLLTLNTGNDGRPYDAFLREKVAFDRSFGFTVDDADLSPALRPHQAAIVKWAAAGGRRAIFARFGLGKSIMQLELIRLALTHPSSEARGGRGLIVAPLRVQREFIHDALQLLGIEARFIRRTEQIDDDWAGIYVTNYESVRDRKLDVSLFDAVSLDEAAVLAAFGSDTSQALLELFDSVTYRWLATATPAPNEHRELINYAAFLGIMDRGAALTRFFHRDSEKAGELTLYPHKEREFWLWLNTWACFVQKPSDLGYPDDGYTLPELTVHWHEVAVDIATDAVDRDGQGRLFRGGAMSTMEAAREKKATVAERVAMLMDIVREHHATADNDARPDQIILWCDRDDEQTAIEKALKAEGLSFSSVHGKLTDEEAERRLDAWCDRETYALIGKPVMLGQGMNLQQANTAVFVGVTYMFRQTIQAVHRIHRFGQERACTVHLILAETEGQVRDVLEAKWVEHDALTARMSELIREHGLSALSISTALTRSMGVERQVAAGDGWHVALNDCVVEMRDHMDDCTVGLIVTSIPFGNHYEYSLNYADFGHNDDYAQFWWQMDYATAEAYRVLQPGRLMVVHVKDRIQYGRVTHAGLPTVEPFHAQAIAHYTGHGFDYLGMVTIETDVVRENNQTYRLGYSKMLQDGSNMGVGSPEYLLLLHKPRTDRSKGWGDERIVKMREAYGLGRWQLDADAKWRSSGNRLLTVDELIEIGPEDRSRLFTEQMRRTVYDYAEHVRLAEALRDKNALPSSFASLRPGAWTPWVWDDVMRMRTLNGEQSRKALEFHICPLQFDIVDRAIVRWSNDGDLVFDPFGGLGTVPLRARKLGRRGAMSELNPTSYRDAVMYQRELDNEQSIPALFDLLALEEGSAA